MERRKLLANFGAILGTASLGGCLSQYEEAAGGVDETTTGTTAKRETTTTTRPPTLAGTTFELTDAGCGQPTNEAEVGFDAESGSVSVTGTISGSNACYVAELADAGYDPETGTLELTVASMQKDEAGACAQCIVEIDYEATASFEDGLPAEVRVVHQAMGEAETVTTAATATATTAGATTTADSE
ncbi:hypothetical protein [Halorussus lipolyticus]|uniref:hypothetical protein n=1 Tax=Halorussus lipolyticus TaxID=3034024 RepID=UPI0023E8B01A|nr:hypothetical protein [Halorussus sp. DT80]